MKKTCFVIIGYGEKTSYAGGKARKLDLEETYNELIKPVFDKLNMDCYRSKDLNTSANIDITMLNAIKLADYVVADLSTLNANVMWELGVRHALKPQHTIMICEKEQMSELPFDVCRYPIYEYIHTEYGLVLRDVERFRSTLEDLVLKLESQNPPKQDSPVFDLLEKELQADGIPNANHNLDLKSMFSHNFVPLNKVEADDPNFSIKNEDSFSSLLLAAEQAKDTKNYILALEKYEKAEKLAKENIAFRPALTNIICKKAVCTYKGKEPTEEKALIAAREIMEVLKPAMSFDAEVLGVTAAIKKRLFELTKNISYLKSSIKYYERGFTLLEDYYTGINTAFMYYLLASLELENKNYYKQKAAEIRDRVLKIALQRIRDPQSMENKESVWVLLTIAEAYHMQGNNGKMKEYEEKARTFAEETNQAFAMDSYEGQKNKFKALNI